MCKTQQPIRQPVEVDNSSGFHVLEIHMPTAGLGLISLILIVASALLLYKCIRRFKGRGQAPPSAIPFFPPTGFEHLTHQNRASIVYLDGPRFRDITADEDIAVTPAVQQTPTPKNNPIP